VLEEYWKHYWGVLDWVKGAGCGVNAVKKRGVVAVRRMRGKMRGKRIIR